MDLYTSLTGYEQLYIQYIHGFGLWKSTSPSVVLQVTVRHFVLESNTMEEDGRDGMRVCMLPSVYCID